MKTYTNKINGIVYRITVEEVLYSQAQVLFNAINRIPCDEIKDGYKIQIGFSLYILVKNSDDDYTVVVGDYTKNPFKDTTEDLTLAFGIQFQQFDILRTYKIAGEAVRFDDKIVVAKGALDKEAISLQRFADLGESGWCVEGIGVDENGNFVSEETREYESYYAFELLNIRPCLVEILLLPYNYMVIVNGDDVVEILNEQNQSVMGE
ncbi:MAG: hypothetical protein UD936_02130 [Acutalibacteraceae bacterium]|nr:hypothetical protein [Acutalibacteraceae bacterium]